MFTSRLVNKMWYVWYGSKNTFKNEIPLHTIIQLEVDGAPIELHESLSGLIILNLNSYAGGVDLWGKEIIKPVTKYSKVD